MTNRDPIFPHEQAVDVSVEEKLPFNRQKPLGGQPSGSVEIEGIPETTEIGLIINHNCQLR